MGGSHDEEELAMQMITTIGLDIAKSVFQVHGVDAAGDVVIRRQLEEALRPGILPEAVTMPGWHRGLRVVPLLVARTPGTWPYRAINAAGLCKALRQTAEDMADAEAICEAVTRANMRFVPTKTPEQQSCLMLHRTRHLFIRQQTAVINSIRAHLAEFGIVAPVGRKGVTELLHIVADPSDKRVPEVARACLAALGNQLLSLKEQIVEFDRMIMVWHRSNPTSKRLNCILCFGDTPTT